MRFDSSSNLKKSLPSSLNYFIKERKSLEKLMKFIGIIISVLHTSDLISDILYYRDTPMENEHYKLILLITIFMPIAIVLVFSIHNSYEFGWKGFFLYIFGAITFSL